MSWVVMRHQGASRTAAGCAILIAIVGTAPGCKSGSSWTSKPSWWSFGGTPDATKLADAPPAGDVTKPSTTSKPYPTTSTPEGYVLGDGQKVEQASAANALPPAATPAATAITYGSTPPPAAVPATTTAPQQAAGGLSAITPQVGPYGSPPTGGAIDPLPNTAAAAATPSAFGAPPAAAFPGTTPAPAAGGAPALTAVAPAAAAPAAQRFGSPAERVADARSAPNWQSPPEAAASPAPGSRYETATGSRFSGGGFSAPPPAPPADPYATLPAAASPLPAVPSADPLAPPAAALPPMVAPPAAPAAMPPSAAPAVPTRRPDPGYRPGGTSSYRPSRTILAGGADTVDAAVQPVSFETELPAAP